MSRHYGEDFKQAQADFYRAIDDLLQPFTVTTIDGTTATIPPLIDQVQTLHRAIVIQLNSQPDSYPPIWVDRLDLLNSIMHAITGGKLHHAYTNARDALESALERPYSPTDTAYLTQATTTLETARHKCLALVYPAAFTIDAPCPECGAREAARKDELGHIKRGPALAVHDFWAECSACNTQWWEDEIVTLATITQDTTKETTA